MWKILSRVWRCPVTGLMIHFHLPPTRKWRWRFFGQILTRLVVDRFPSFPVVNLLLVRSHQAEIIIIKRFIQGCNNMTRVRVEPRSCDWDDYNQGCEARRKRHGSSSEAPVLHIYGISSEATIFKNKASALHHCDLLVAFSQKVLFLLSTGMWKRK